MQTSIPLPPSLRVLTSLQSTAHYCFSLRQFETLSGRLPGGRASRAALSRLHAQGLITPVARGSGFWLIVPPEHMDRGAPPVLWWLHDYLMRAETAYHLALLSAAQAHGTSHFAVQETQVFVSGPRRPLAVGSQRLRFFCKKAVSDAPVVTLSGEKSDIRVSSIATTLLDLLRHAASVGGVERIALIVKDLASKLTVEDIRESLEAAQDVAAAQRLGYLLEHLGYGALADGVEKWLLTRRMQRARLDTSSPTAECATSSRWLVVNNCDLESSA